MNTHVIISAECVGDVLTAISKTIEVAKAIKETITLKIDNDIFLSIRPDSNVLELAEIVKLRMEIKELQNK